MAKILLTFLGRTRKGQTGYRTTCYDFGDNAPCEPVAFFGWTLQKRLAPERMVILGTAGSMWDHLTEADFDFGSLAEDERLVLAEKVERQQVTEDDLRPLEPLLGERLGCEVRLRLIPYCRDEREQIALLRILADEVVEGDPVELDITHGFRHLPMLGLLAALYLRKVRGAGIEHIWYGALDMTQEGKTPVLDLVGLLRIADWIEALAVYERSGDYGVFGRLIGGEVGEWLAEASFLETVNRIGQARSRLREVLRHIDRLDDPVLQLFRDELRRRIAWAEGGNYYQRQRELALEYLRRERFLEAILTGWEAFTTRLQREESRHLDPDNHEHREQVRRRFEERERQVEPRTGRYRAYDSLRRLRNAVAHGSQPKGEEVQRALGGRVEMKALLAGLFSELLPAE